MGNIAYFLEKSPQSLYEFPLYVVQPTNEMILAN